MQSAVFFDERVNLEHVLTGVAGDEGVDVSHPVEDHELFGLCSDFVHFYGMRVRHDGIGRSVDEQLGNGAQGKRIQR